MTTAERTAANTAMGHAGMVHEFYTTILVIIGALALTWVYVTVLGIWTPVKSGEKKDIGEALGETVLAFAILTVAGACIALAL